MDLDINSFNVEISIFLRHLKYYGNKKHFQINEKTLELLMEAIDALVSNARLNDACKQNCVDFLFDLDENHYELRQCIMCRLCLEQISVNKDDFDAHQLKSTHIHRVQQAKNLPQISPKNEGSVTSGIDSIFTDEESYEIDRLLNDLADDNNQPASIKDDEEILELNSSSLNIIEVRGLPWVVTKRDILSFFSDINILNGANGIHFAIDFMKNQCNQAFIQLQSEKDLRKALNYNCTKMGIVVIRVKPVSNVSKFKELITQKGYPQNQNVIRLDNLPPDSGEDIVRCLFPEIEIEKIYFPERETGKYTADVFVVLSDVNDVEKVLKMNGKKIDSNVIKMFRSCHEQLEYRCASPDSALSNSPELNIPSDNPNDNTEKKSYQEIDTGNMNAEWIRVSAPEILPSKEAKPLNADMKTVGIQKMVSSMNKDNLIKLTNNNGSSEKATIHATTPPVLSEFKENSSNIYNGLESNDVSYVLQTNGFPWSMTKQEILQFFVGVKILNGTNGCHFIIDNRLNKCNKLYIQLATENDYRKAQCYNNRKLNGSNIEVIPVKIVEKFQRMIEHPEYPADHNVLRLADLHKNTTEDMIRTFFHDFQIMEIKFAVIPANRTSREAFVLFGNERDIEKALSMDGGKINNVPAEIYRSSIAQMQYYTTIPSKRKKIVIAEPTNILTEKIPSALESEGEADSTADGIIRKLPEAPILETVTFVESSKSAKSSLHVIHVAGLPWQITKAKVIEMFATVDILNDCDGIHFIINERRNKMNQAYLQLKTEKDFKEALKYNNTYIDPLYIEISEADPVEFLKMINDTNYPQNQNVVRLFDLPHYCNADMIKILLFDLNIIHVELVFGRIKLLTCEAFVVFSNSKDVEKALNMGKKVIGEIPIKIHRSSQEQMKFHSDSKTKQWLAVPGSPNIDSPNLKSQKRISARGFPWATCKADIKKFFKGVRIINGEQGIQMAKKSSAIEANFMINNEAEAQKALAFNGQKFESKVIYVYKIDSEEQNDNFC